MAIGDAYGAGFEFAPREFVMRHNDVKQYYQHQKHKSLTPGRYTDDTQMAIAIAELCVSGKEWTPLAIASAFVDTFKRDVREGYSQGLYQILCSVQSGSELLERLRPDSIKNGAAMRAGPIGAYYDDVDEVLDKARVQAIVTHNTDIGIRSAQASALMSFYFTHNVGSKDLVGKYVENHVAGDWSTPFHEKTVNTIGYNAVRAAITAIQEEPASQKAVLKRCIAFTGDVDTVGAIALGSIGFSGRFERDLPQGLLHSETNSDLYTLEPSGNFGVRFLRDLSRKLW